MPPVRFITAGLLPDQLRDGFGLPWSPRHRRRFDRTMRTFGAVYRPLPQWVRHWFKDYYLSRLEAG
jgi:uncharacterized protein (DUF2236 family)